MNQRPEDINPFDPFGTGRAIRDASIDAWSKALQQFVNTDAYSQATTALLDSYLTTSAPFRKALEQTMTQVLQQFNMPNRAEVISIAERLTNIETRLDDLDAQLATIRRALQPSAAPSQYSRSEQEQATTPGPSESAAASMDPVVETLSETGDEQGTVSSKSKRWGGQAREQQP